MRSDINIFWVEDFPEWCHEQKEIIELHIDDMGLCSNITCESNGKTVIDAFGKESDGFKVYDIFLIDYTLSNGVLGDAIINRLRESKINSDILFYSSDKEDDIRKAASKNLSEFEGVYLANRDNFMDKCINLIEKNSKRLLSISNIRGFLMDQTSENDFIVNSYLLKAYGTLNPNEKASVQEVIRESLDCKINEYNRAIQIVDTLLARQDINNINTFMGHASYIISVDLKYRIFEKIMELKGKAIFEENSIANYLGNIVKKRNTIAHKKLEVCRQQQYLQYYDNINQYENRTCPDDCLEHNNEHKISIDDWLSLRKDVLKYAICYDSVIKEMMESFV